MIYAVNKRTKEHRLIGERPCLGHYPGVDEFWVEADADGWIPWDGGECPLPEDAEHEVRFGDGKVVADDDPSSWCWSHDPARRIVAYRPILDEPRQATLAGANLWQDAEGTIQCREGDPVGCVGEPPAWDGEGLPPEGIECEAEDDYGQWQRCRVVGTEGSQLWLDFVDDGYVTRHIHDAGIRPIRSEEDRAVEEMMESLRKSSGASGTARICRTLYRAGFRKTGGE